MKKNFFDKIMFGLSIIYLFGAIILIITKKIEWNIINLFNTDGLALLGCIFAFGELVFSKRNAVSKYINQKLISNRVLQYRIGIVLEIDEVKPLEYWINTLEKDLREGLIVEELSRKAISEIANDSCKMYYQTCGCMIDFYKNNKSINIRITGKAKYGKLHSKKNDILYLSLLIEILNNRFIQDDVIRKKGNIKNFELSVLKSGSQIAYGNIFNNELKDVENYNVTMSNSVHNNIQFFLNDDEVMMKMINVTSIYDGYVDFTNLLCTIE